MGGINMSKRVVMSRRGYCNGLREYKKEKKGLKSAKYCAASDDEDGSK